MQHCTKSFGQAHLIFYFKDHSKNSLSIACVIVFFLSLICCQKTLLALMKSFFSSFALSFMIFLLLTAIFIFVWLVKLSLKTNCNLMSFFRDWRYLYCSKIYGNRATTTIDDDEETLGDVTYKNLLTMQKNLTITNTMLVSWLVHSPNTLKLRLLFLLRRVER